MNSTTKIIVPHRVTRAFITEHPDYIFVYGCDVIGKACLGQAWECFNEPNTFGIPTMIKYCSAKQCFSDDYNAAQYREYIDKAIDKIPLDSRPIIVLPRIGRGCSRMFELAPKLYIYMMTKLGAIRYKDIEIDYTT